jgi:amino acid adenylation domain-containing protein
MFVLQNTPQEVLRVEGLEMSGVGAVSESAKFDLTLAMAESGDCLVAHWKYDTDLFEAASIERMAECFEVLLRSAVHDPEQHIARLPLLSSDARRELLVEWNETTTEYGHELSLPQLFEQQVERTPQSIALIFEEEQLTYAALNERANQLAHHLHTLGVGPESLVGLFLPRSIEMVVALLGILKAGAAYLPLDPQYPQERLRFMLEDANVQVLLTSPALSSALPAHQAQVLQLTPHSEQFRTHSGENPQCTISAENLAYVIYTSGSTGTPKGTLITHGGLANYLAWAIKAYPLAGAHGSVLHSSISFDLTVTSLYPALLSGRSVQIVSEAEGVEGLAHALVERQGFSLVKLTPAHVQLLSTQLEAEQASALTQALVIGGENLLAETLRWWREHAPQTRLFNEYGPTETVVGCCVYEVKQDGEQAQENGQREQRESGEQSGSVPIGRPIANTRLYILDEEQQCVPVGVSGELYIGGAGVGRGYLNRAELTAERFVPDPYSRSAGARLYRTGDVVRYRADGVIEYLGRRDEQVKVRGFRIELGEIEAVLSQHEAVREAVVIARAQSTQSSTESSAESSTQSSGEKRLVAYVVSSTGERVNVSELRSYLKEQLPDYMVPSAFVELAALPLTVNGKVNRAALPAPDASRPELTAAYVAPRSAIERRIAEVWQEVLGLEAVGVGDNFFDLGGHSLQVVRVHGKLRAEFGEGLSLVELFHYPTISALAGLISQESSEVPSFEKVYDRVSKQKEAIAQQKQLMKERKRIYG